ncbi:MAG TPA: chlorite dismutase family protein [Acidimicrobiia bacterium]|nr:chlorite dismutase family protein [Acidimicrobiia bacterium]
MEPVELSVGWGVLHLFYATDRVAAAADPKAGKRVLDAVRSLEADEHQALLFTVLGHKADLGVMVLGPDLARLQAFQQELAATPLRLVDSFVSFTELSEYTSSEDDERARLASEEGLSGPAAEARLAAWRERMTHYQEQRLHPHLPLKRAICFYPMSKRRVAGANWYSLPFDARKRLMAGHARVGRTYAGRVLQLITGATGIDDWEWGVTLLADDPVALKEIVYEMRFDPVSADFAEFGPFVTGLLAEPEDALSRVGL